MTTNQANTLFKLLKMRPDEEKEVREFLAGCNIPLAGIAKTALLEYVRAAVSDVQMKASLVADLRPARRRMRRGGVNQKAAIKLSTPRL